MTNETPSTIILKRTSLFANQKLNYCNFFITFDDGGDVSDFFVKNQVEQIRSYCSVFKLR